MSRLQLFLVLATAHNYEAVSAGGCQVECGAGNGIITVKGVDGLVVNGADVFSMNRAIAEATSSLNSTADEIATRLKKAGNDVNASFQDKRRDTTDRVESKLYTGNTALLDKINQHRQFVREERRALIQHLECNKVGRLWSEDRKMCMPAATEFCGAMPIDGIREKVLHDCVGIKGTECETHCPTGWSGEAITYVCTGSKDTNGGWQRIKAHGNRNAQCHNVDECAYPDYPCNSRAYMCTDTEGSFECACHFSMVESAEKASNGRGETCECPNLSWWQFVSDVTPFCTCPFGGEMSMEVNSAGVCVCPEDPDDGEELEVLGYPDEHFIGSVAGVRNQNPENLNYNCPLPPATSCREIYLRDPSSPSGDYAIKVLDDDGSVLFDGTVACDMDGGSYGVEDGIGGGWTLVYKISEKVAMKNTGAENVQALIGGNAAISKDNQAGKLSDKAIRKLCDGQFRVQQWKANKDPMYCRFEDINEYTDAAKNQKYCSFINNNGNTGNRYKQSPSGYTKKMSKGWSYGFSTWGTVRGANILQLNYGGGRKGSHKCWHCSSTDSNCGSQGGCHSNVWCLPSTQSMPEQK